MMYKDNIGKGWIFLSCDEYNHAGVISKGLCPPVCKTVFEISAGGKMLVRQRTDQAVTDSSGKQPGPRYSLLEWLLWNRVLSATCIRMIQSQQTAARNFERPQNSIVNLWWMVNTLQTFSRAGNGIELAACCKTMCAQGTKSMFRPTNNGKRRVHARYLSPATCPKGWGNWLCE